MQKSFFWGAAILTLAASSALAHSSAESVSGISAGFIHPIGGLDHVLAMVAVGILAAQLGGKSILLVPASFVGMMVVGCLLGIAGIPVLFIEFGIVGSVVILGVVIATEVQVPTGLAMSLVGLLAVFHGYAHGTEMPLNANGIEYGMGFIIATAVLHAVGALLGIGIEKITRKFAPTTIRAGGAIIATVGVFLFAT